DRDNQEDALKEHGADFVVTDLAVMSVVEEPPTPPLIDELPDAANCLDHVSRTPETRVAVLLDYDGTLSPIVERPEDATISKEMRRTLARLAEHCTVAIVSGRDLDDVCERVGLDNLIYAGYHGFAIAGPGNLHTRTEEVE